MPETGNLGGCQLRVKPSTNSTVSLIVTLASSRSGRDLITLHSCSATEYVLPLSEADLAEIQVASGNMGYSGGPKDPVYHYHSIYDSFTWQEK